MNKIFNGVKNFFTVSIRRQLMLGIVVVHAVLMTIFVYDLVNRQRDFLHDQSIEQANSLVETLAANSTSWVLSNDVIGLEEVLQSQTSYPDLLYAMVLDLEGRVLGHTDISKTGLYISDEVSRSLFESDSQKRILVDSVKLVDVASPIFSNGEAIGWARVGLGQGKITSGLRVIEINGILYTLIAILIGAIFAFYMARGITRDLQRIVNVAEGVKQGDLQRRSQLVRKDELGHLSDNLNTMLDTIEKNKGEMQDIMDHSPAVIYAKDLDGRYIFTNLKWKKIFNPENTQIIGKNDYDIFAKEFADEVTANDKLVLAAKHELEYEESVPQDDGLHTYVTVKFPLTNPEGEIYAICGISTDITLRKRQEKGLRYVQKMDALGKLTGGIAHDYNNMLGVILGYTEILANKCSDKPEILKDLKTIQHAGERGARLTKKLLSFSKRTGSDKNILYINSLLQDQYHMLEKVLTVRIKLTLDLDNELWPIWIDSDDFEDAIINMCINAMHAMHAMHGDGKLVIKASNETLNTQNAQSLDLEKGDYIMLSLADTGCGMNEETLEKIFDPFFSTKGEHGTGLGLNQIYGLVERSGGVIKVYSELGKGTRFVLYFPRYHGDDDKSGQQAATTSDDKFNGTGTILVVDDEPALLKLAAQILRARGYHIVSAASAERALEILEEESVDLMLSDVIMPDMDGYQLAAIVKEKYPTIKIQLSSGFADNDNIDMVDEKLQENILLKPYNIDRLLAKVQKLLG